MPLRRSALLCGALEGVTPRVYWHWLGRRGSEAQAFTTRGGSVEMPRGHHLSSSQRSSSSQSRAVQTA